jgi:hypothetical protein
MCKSNKHQSDTVPDLPMQSRIHPSLELIFVQADLPGSAWACKVCTLENSPQLTICGVCNTARESFSPHKNVEPTLATPGYKSTRAESPRAKSQLDPRLGCSRDRYRLMVAEAQKAKIERQEKTGSLWFCEMCQLSCSSAQQYSQHHESQEHITNVQDLMVRKMLKIIYARIFKQIVLFILICFFF